MPTYSDLRKFAKKLGDKAEEWHIPFELLQYSAEIGCFIRVNQIHEMNMQTKYVMLFRGCDFDDIQVVINAFSPLEKNSLSKNEDSRQSDKYGRDVYQNVEQFIFYQESANSSDEYDLSKLEASGARLLNAQQKAFCEQSTLSTSELNLKMKVIKKHFRDVQAYLRNPINCSQCVQIRRESGIGHKLKLKPNTGSKKVTFSSVLILFGIGSKYPEQSFPQKSKGGGNPSIAAQYKANPSSFKYYDKFGIFEVYDK